MISGHVHCMYICTYIHAYCPREGRGEVAGVKLYALYSSCARFVISRAFSRDHLDKVTLEITQNRWLTASSRLAAWRRRISPQIVCARARARALPVHTSERTFLPNIYRACYLARVSFAVCRLYLVPRSDFVRLYWLSSSRQGSRRAWKKIFTMPLLRKQPFQRLYVSSDFRDDDEVYHCEVTNEIFKNYK